MKIFVMVDMEGISGICQRSQVSKGDPNYARKYMTWDVNACVRGCLSGGAEKVTVRDAHAGGFNLIWEELDPRADYIQGRSGKHRMPGIKGCDALILLGYHAMAGTPEAILEHTMTTLYSSLRLWTIGCDNLNTQLLTRFAKGCQRFLAL